MVSCIDFRIQETLENFLKENDLLDKCDRIEIAGGAKDTPEVISQLKISHRLHHPEEIWLFQHEDCGAYGLAKESPKEEELNVHKKDLAILQETIKNEIDKDLIIRKFLITLAGGVMLIND